MIPADALTGLVRAWLPSQRWFGGKGRDADVTVRPLVEFGDGVELWLIRVDYTDGTAELYQLPLVAHAAAADNLEHVLLGTVTDDGTSEPRWIYDALHDKDVTRAWLVGIRDEQVQGPLRFHRYVDPEAIPVEETSLVLTGEQSNTSLMFSDVALLKVFRRLQPGQNPDIEIHAALGEHGARHIARLLGSVEAEIDGESYALAMAQEYMTTATDGWELANASVRDLMAERDLHAEEAGGDFAGEAFRLGTAIAQTHADLVAAFGTATVGVDDVTSRAAAMHARLDDAIPVVPDLDEFAPELHKIFDTFAEGTPRMTVQRIHGDLHLGQVLRTVHRWVVIDFEGEPMLELSARRAPDTALRDIAGMLRSFEYAGYHRLVDTGGDAQLSYRAEEWVTRNRTAFCDGYADAAGYDPRDEDAQLRAFEVDKAVYEAVYEARNRPAWLGIPVQSLRRLAGYEVTR